MTSMHWANRDVRWSFSQANRRPGVSFSFWLVTGFAVLVGAAHGQQPAEADAAKDVATVKPFVSETTIVVVKLDPARLRLPNKATPSLENNQADKALQDSIQQLLEPLKKLQELADGQPMYATIGVPVSKRRMELYGFRRKTNDANAKELMEVLRDEVGANADLQGDYIVASPAGIELTTPVAAEDRLESIAAAFKSVSRHPIQVLVVPPDHVWRTIRELSPELPEQLGGGPSRVLTDGVRWVGIGLDPERLLVEVVIQSASETAAEALAVRLPVLLQSAHQTATPVHAFIPADLAKLLIGWVEPQVDGSQVKIRLNGAEKTAENLALLSRIREMFRAKTQVQASHRQFRTILLGLHNYFGANRVLPPSDQFRDKNGKPGLSWRVHILPYLEQLKLYEKFHLDEPWDSPHNKKLIAEMPNIYARPPLRRSGKLKAGYTTFLAPVGDKTIFGGPKALGFQHITDGSSNTIALLEVTPERAVPWTAPQDYKFDSTNPLAGVFVGAKGKWFCAFADGSVHLLRGELPVRTVLNLFERNDGNLVEPDEIH